MRFIFGIFISFLFLTSGCEKSIQLPVEEKKVVDILVDIHFAEAASQHLTGIRKDTSLRKYYKQIFEIHRIDQADFDTTMSMISKNPAYLKQIYIMVQDSIQVRSLNAVN